MPKTVRSLFFLICAIQLLFAIAFFFQVPFVVAMWPFEGTTSLTYIFLSSFFAAAAASTLWSVATENDGSLAGVALDYIAILTPLAVFSFQVGVNNGNTSFIPFGILCILGALFGLGLLLWSLRVPMDQTIPMPGPVRWSFVLFILVLVSMSARLLLKVPNSMPWNITPELSVVIGWMFTGAALYFVYGLLRPSWVNAAGQLARFLAYDMVLIVPFLARLPSIAPVF